LQHVHRHDRKT
jgi:single-strand DNA-binding protein